MTPTTLTRRRLMGRGLTIGGGLSMDYMAWPLPGLGVAHAQPEAASAILGSGSLKEHARAHGLLAGAAVNIQLLASDETYARILAEQ